MIVQVTSISTSSMSCWTFLSCESSTPGPHAVAPRTVDDVDGGLTMVVKKLREGARLAHVSRCDLDALAAHTGEKYAQAEVVPEAVHASIRALFSVRAIVLLPPRAGRGTCAGEDGVVMLLDADGAIKGLPPNALALRLIAACGAQAVPRGDVFFCRLREEDGALSLGGEATQQMMIETDWLQKAQQASKIRAQVGDKGKSALETALEARLAAAVARTAEADASAASAAAAAVAAEAAKVAEDGKGPGTMTWANEADGAVVVRVVVPGGTKSKDVRCDVKDVGTEKSTLRLEVATLAPDALVVDGELFYPVKAADSSWSLEDAKGGRRELALTMEKKHENLRWLALLRSGFGPPGAVAMRSE